MSLGLFLLFVWFVLLNETNQINQTDEIDQSNRPVYFARLVRASVFEGEFRDGGLIQLAFAECDQSQVLIVGRLSERDGEPGGLR